MNKYLRRFLWLLPIFSGVTVFLLATIVNLNRMKQLAGDGNYNPVDAILIGLGKGAIAGLVAVQISIVVGFSWWAFVLGKSVLGKDARLARKERAAEQAALIKKETDAL